MERFFNSLSIMQQDLDVKEFSPLTLAYIGDSIFDICVKTYILNFGNMQANKMHNKVKKIVNATYQSKLYFKLEKFINDEELLILKRGRNAKSYSSAKNADISDYRRATGVEALFGYLYIKRDFTRIIELFNICLNENEE